MNQAFLRPLLVFFFVLPQLVCAALPAPEELQDIKERVHEYKEAKGKIVRSDVDRRLILGSLYKINQRMKKISVKRDELTGRMLSVKGNVRTIARNIAELEQKLERQQKGLSKRLRALYMLNGQGALRILFSFDNSMEFDRNLKYLKLISDRDVEMINNYKEILNELNQRRNDLKQQVLRLVALNKKIEMQEGELNKDQGTKTALLQSLKKQRQHYLKRMKDLRQVPKDLAHIERMDKDLELLMRGSFFEKKGQLDSPVTGVAVEDYGLTQHPGYRYQLRNKGIYYSAVKGSDVSSVFAGRVGYVGPLPGLGTTVILDHGDHFYTVYSHIVSPTVKFDQLVPLGATLGKVGTGNPVYGTGIHFEVRHFSEAVDPSEWIKAPAALGGTEEGTQHEKTIAQQGR